jgi:ribonucleoside-diphosphate reductase alpha chain
MSVVKRNGSSQDVSYHKLVTRLGHITRDLPGVEVDKIASTVSEFVADGVRTDQLDNFIAMTCAGLIYTHPDYDVLATRIAVEHLHKKTDPSFVAVMKKLRDAGRVSPALVEVAEREQAKIEGAIVMARDYDFDYFGFRTLERSYLMSCSPDDPPVERPQHTFMRVAMGIHGDDVDAAIQTYDLMSTKHFVHATPTLFNSGTNFPQLSSCYLLEIEDDSIDGIFHTIHACARISKFAGGLGVHIHKIRAKGSSIASTGGTSTGIIPMLRVFNNVARYVNQGGRRSGSISIYLEPWHADIEAFIELRRNGGHGEDRCRDLFTALWIPDEFFRRVQADGMWSLMCPHECPGLSDAVGDDFVALYEKYEAEGCYVRQIRAKELWNAIVTSEIETGTPYLCSKDASNLKSNQKHLGTIKSSNLCSEVIQFTSPDESSVCNLASFCLPTYVRMDAEGKPYFDHEKLAEVVAVATRNLEKVITVNMYPTDNTRRSNLKHRPMGMGVQGLADMFALMGVAYDSDEAYELEREVFRTMYYAAVKTSCALAKEFAAQPARNEFDEIAKASKWPGAHASFEGSPMQQGILQPDMWDKSETHDGTGDKYDWDGLRKDVMEHGVRNSLMIALMPTATTSQILGASECIEPIGAVLYKRKTLAGEFTVLNRHLARDLIKRGLWNEDVRDQVILANGSIQGVKSIPADVRALYKTCYDVKQRHVIRHAANRGPYVCQSTSTNLYVTDPTLGKMSAMYMYAWQCGLKTLSYYTRVSQKARPQQFTVTPERAAALTAQKDEPAEDAPCLMCSS